MPESSVQQCWHFKFKNKGNGFNVRNNNLLTKYPIKMIPIFKDYIWGGNRLITEWKKPSNYDIAAESWELSAHQNGQSVAANGVLAGYTLSEIVESYGSKCLGTHSAQADRFPVLIKLIDSKQRLSIQVHPDDTYALKNESDYGKTEMWYIVDAGEDSGILCGMKQALTREEFLESIRQNTITDHMNWVPVKKGDVFFIAPGTVHAICEGTIIAEIQQNSDVTYRVYDYDRKGADGKTRPLHIEKALDVSKLTGETYDGKPAGATIPVPGGQETLLAECRYFTVKKYDIAGMLQLDAGTQSFQSLLFLDGEGRIAWGGEEIHFVKGDTFFIPAGTGEYVVSGKSTVLLTEV